jgi:hypothetical protein
MNAALNMHLQTVCTLPPNPSIERTSSGKPEAAAHVER